MSPEKKTKIASISAVATVLFALLVGVLTFTQSNHVLPLALGIGALLYGPICFIAYLLEIKKGVFTVGEDNSEE